MEQFQTEMLKVHNEFRSRHQASPLRANQQLAAQSQKWAERLAAEDKLQHDPQCQKDSVGENVAMKYSSNTSEFPANVFVDYWYSEIKDYVFDPPTEDQINCGHFTQVVWKASEEAGFGKAVAKSGKVYVVGRYKPGGNFIGEFCKNVLPPADGKIVLPESVQGGSNPQQQQQQQKQDQLKPVIGPKNPADKLISSNVSTSTRGQQKTVRHRETYRTPTGDTYTLERETTSTV